MSASETNNPSLPSRVRIKDIRILSATELSKKLDVWLDGKPCEKIELMPKMEPDKSWAMEDDAFISETLMIQPYFHRSPFQRGAKKKAESIEVKADELRTAIGNLTSRIQYSRSERDGNTFIIGIEPDNAKEDQSGYRLKISSLEPFQFDTWPHSMLEIQILEHQHMHKTKLVGRFRETMQELLVKLPGEISLDPFKYNPSISKNVSLVLAIEILSEDMPAEERQADDAFKQASKQIAAVLSPSALGSSVIQGAELVQKSLEFIKNVLSMVIDKVDVLSEIHPYAKMAWSVISVIPKAYLDDQSRLKQLQGLLLAANKSYEVVKRAVSLNPYNIPYQKQIITQIIQQTTECAYFIRDYLLSGGFAFRQMKNLILDVQAHIDEYQKSFEALAQEFHQEAALQTEISVFHTVNMLTDLTAEHVLNDLAYASGARFDFDKLCLPGTRVDIIDEIINWVNQTNNNDIASRIYLLAGGAGFGKSTIARTVAQRFKAIGRLGSSFAFNCGKQQTINASSCFSTIALDIADTVPSWKASLVDIIKHDHGLRHSIAVKEQFRELLVKPGETLVITGPILVVIDALDECPIDAPFQNFIDTLVKQSADLPLNIHILMTSHPEVAIHDAFYNKPHIYYKNMEEIDAKSTQNDIYKFVKSELENMAGDKHDSWSLQIAEKAEGLFQWAATACRFIKDSNLDRGLFLNEKFDKIMRVGSSQLDALYIAILEHAFSHMSKNDIVKNRFCRVLDCVLSVKEPLPLDALCKLYNDHNNEFKIILKPLASLFYGVISDDDLNVPVRPSHISFREFLMDEMRSGQFYVAVTSQNENLARGSLTIMRKNLHFNMYNFKSSYDQNKDVSTNCLGIITPDLKYSCQYWADHFSAAFKNDINMISMLRDWANEQILFWLEIHSLQFQHIKYAKYSLEKVLSVLKSSNEMTLIELLEDASQFITQFAMPISQSVPHIYLSGVQFSPQNSCLVKCYHPKFNTILDPISKRPGSWPQIQVQITGSSACLCIALSPDGKQIVSGSHDKTIRLWDAQTGAQMGDPLTGHDNRVTSVAFSPDGKQIVSGSWDKTIQLWDAQTGAQMGDPLIGHDSFITSVAFSPDGKQIVSGSDDRTIQLWDAQTGAQMGDPLTGYDHWVTSVAFSPDGKQIVSGSRDNTIRLWDAQTGAQMGDPLTGHNNWVTSVAFSPNGKHIVSGSWDQTIRLWDAQTGAQMGDPLTGHDDVVTSVPVPSNGKQLVSQSDGSTALLSKISTMNCLYTNQSVVSPDGWVYGPQSQLLFWLPHWYRTGLYRPSLLQVMGPVHTAKIDMNKFHHGEDWAKCYLGNN